MSRHAGRASRARPAANTLSSRATRSTLLGAALRRVLASGYSLADLRADAAAGLVVGVVALPLSLALAIAVGVPPQHGLYTAIVAGLVVAPLGGSRFQVSGPTAAFVVVLAPIASTHGIGGLLLATLLAGGFLVAFGWARLGHLMRFVPYPVTAGFTAGIGLVIAILQLRDLLGLSTGPLPDHTIEKVRALLSALPSWRAADLAVGLLTLTLLVVWPRFDRRLPAPLVALALGGLAAWMAARFHPVWAVETIDSRFGAVADGVRIPGIPRALPEWRAPWRMAGAGGESLDLSFDLVRELLPPALTIALLGAIESLLSAVVADGMTGTEHDPDAELIAQGAGNLVAPFFGGIAATGAIARTATNIRAGGRSPVASMVHGAFLLAAIGLLAPLLGLLPMASLAALLLLVAWRMSEARHVVHVVRSAPRSDAAVLLVCFGLTVAFDMVIAVITGIVLAALLFMRRMAEVSHVELVSTPHRRRGYDLPESVVLYEIQGPLFFGAAQRAMRALHDVASGVRCVLIDLRSVPALDATGLFNLDSAIARLERDGVVVVLAGLRDQPFRALLRAGYRHRRKLVVLRRSFEQGLGRARALGAEPDP